LAPPFSAITLCAERRQVNAKAEMVAKLKYERTDELLV